MIGQTLNNRYKITERIGRGAMGTVYKATDVQTGQVVAVKVVAGDLAMDPSMLERFKREGETLRQLKHLNIVGFVDAFHHDDQYVIIMEYVTGGSLYELMKTGQMPIERVVQIALDLCDALIRSHRLKIIHRDIKPENVLIAEDGTPKLADFGVARLTEGTRMTRSGMQVGTPYYMAPEAWAGKVLDAQADIWSLGVMLFEMLSGQLPFVGDTPLSVMSKVNTTPAPDLRKLRADVPASIVRIISRMLTKNKTRRYQTMREVAVDLERSQREIVRTPSTGERKPSIEWESILVGIANIWGKIKDFPANATGSISRLIRPLFSSRLKNLPRIYKITLPIMIGAVGIAAVLLGRARNPETYYTLDTATGSEIHYMRGSEDLTILHSTEDFEYWHPAPDRLGNLYFTSILENGQVEIFFLDAKGKKTQFTHTADPFYSWAPAPDNLGNLYFSSNQDGGRVEIYAIDSDGKKHRVTVTPGDGESWSPAPDGFGNVYFVSDQDGNSDIYVIDSKGVKRQVTHSSGDIQNWSPAPDGLGNVYFLSDQDGNSDIYVIDSKGGKHQVTHSPPGVDNWSPAPDGFGNLYFTSNRNGSVQILLMDSKGKTEILADIPANSWLKESSGSPSNPDTFR